jgi:hypothetical protein
MLLPTHLEPTCWNGRCDDAILDRVHFAECRHFGSRVSHEGSRLFVCLSDRKGVRKKARNGNARERRYFVKWHDYRIASASAPFGPLSRRATVCSNVHTVGQGIKALEMRVLYQWIKWSKIGLHVSSNTARRREGRKSNIIQLYYILSYSSPPQYLAT